MMLVMEMGLAKKDTNAPTREAIFSGLGLFALALLIRLPYLGTFLTIDEVKWVEGAGQFLLGLHKGILTETYWHFHPGITITWGETMILWWRYLISSSSDLEIFVAEELVDLPHLIGAMRLSSGFITASSIAGIYWLASPLIGDRAALLGAGLLAVDPFFVAESRIVNGDTSAAGFMMLTFLAFAYLWWEPRWWRAALAGVMAGLALLTKLPAPLILPWVVILAGLRLVRDKQWLFWLRALAVFGLATTITFVSLWPAMWVAPLDTLLLMYKDAFAVGEIGDGHETFFLGQITHNPGWLFYPYIIAFRLTPLTVIGVIAALFWLWNRRLKSQLLSPQTLLVGMLLLYVVFVFVLANSSPKKSDRFVMSVIPALILIAGVGLDGLIGRTATFANTRFRINHPYFLAFVPLIILIQMSFVVTNYPYILTYYNPLFGGYARAAQQVTIGWGEGIEQAAGWLNRQPKASSLLVSAWYSDIARYYLRTGMTDFSSSGKGQLAADYVIFYINQTQRRDPNQAVFNYFSRRQPVFQVDYRGTPYVWVYPAPRMQVQTSGQAKIEGRARLLGYSWQPTPPTAGGQVATLTLFLLTLGTLPDNETFDVSLASTEGRLWGKWQTSSHITWQPDAIVEWPGVLSLPVDMPPGSYQLVIRLVDTHVNSEVTRFPLKQPALEIGK